MFGIVYSIIAGVFINLQNVFNTRAGAIIGSFEINTIVHGLGFIVALIITIFFSDGDISRIGEVRKIYLVGGVFGVIILYTIMKGISLLGVANSSTIQIVSQLIFALTIDTLGLFDTVKVPLSTNRLMGIGIMIVGLVVFNG